MFQRPVTLPTRRPSTPFLATAAVGFGVGAAALVGMVWYGRHHRGRLDASGLLGLAPRAGSTPAAVPATG
jgi:hypothetical protein